MKKFVSMFLLFIAIVISCSSCSCSKEDNLIVYRNFYDQDVTTFNYLITNEYNNIIRIANLIDGLVENDKYGNIVPSIAKSWKSEIVNDKQIWTFYLKDNVYWSDYNGNKYDLVTAHDFVSTFKYSFNYETKSEKFNLPAELIDNGMNYYYATLIKHFDYNEILNKIDDLSINDPYNSLSYYENIKDIFDKCNSSNLCIDDFNTVGVKAINDFELQFTLSKPCVYFLSALTYYSFLPVSEKFLQEVGLNNFGTNKKAILYNGAYLLSNYSHSSRIEYLKNPNYWDKDNVFIDKLVFTKALNYQSPSYARLSYESGNIDEFIVNEKDETGWNEYVVGNNKEGNKENPAGNNTYLTSNFNYSTVYMIFNQNRTNFKYSTLSKEQINVSNKALSNNNFRKALFYGIPRNYYFKDSLNSKLSSVIPFEFISYNDESYTKLLINEYAAKNSISYEEALEKYENDWFNNLELSHSYLDKAIQELNISKNELPIKIEYSYYKDEDYEVYDKVRIEKWNKLLNDCSEDDSYCEFSKVEIVYNDTIKSYSDYEYMLNSKEYSITLLGLYPDYNDPTSYLKSFSLTGELYSYLNYSSSLKIDEMLNNIDNYYLDENIGTRYELCAKLEYYILFEENLILPLSLNGSTKQIVVSNLVPFEKLVASYGLSPFKFKYRKKRTIDYTQNDINSLREKYLKSRGN